MIFCILKYSIRIDGVHHFNNGSQYWELRIPVNLQTYHDIFTEDESITMQYFSIKSMMARQCCVSDETHCHQDVPGCDSSLKITLTGFEPFGKFDINPSIFEANTPNHQCRLGQATDLSSLMVPPYTYSRTIHPRHATCFALPT